MFKKIGIFIVTVVSLFSLFSLSEAAFAGGYGLPTAAKKANYSTNNDIYGVVGSTIRVVLALIGFIFFGYLVYSGLRWMTARGNEEYVTRAKNNLQTSIMGLIIIFIAYAVTTLIFTLLGQQ